MATRRVEILGEAAASGRPGVYLSLVIVFLLIGAALTAFLIFDPKRYWPLLWIAALGRIAGAWVLLSAWNAGISDQALVPAMVDLAFGLGCLAFAMAFLRHGRRLSPSD